MGAPLVGRRQHVSAAHHPGRAWRRVNPTEPGADIPPWAVSARFLSHHRAELSGGARHRVPVALARAVRPHRTRQAYPGRAVESGRALAHPRRLRASLGTKHALFTAGGVWHRGTKHRTETRVHLGKHVMLRVLACFHPAELLAPVFVRSFVRHRSLSASPSSRFTQ